MKNSFKVLGDTTEILVGKEVTCLISTTSLDRVREIPGRWNVMGRYVRSILPDHPTIAMHRWILNCKSEEIVDHMNGNPLDNRLENLRICSRSINARNRFPYGRLLDSETGISRSDQYEAFNGLLPKQMLSEIDRIQIANGDGCRSETLERLLALALHSKSIDRGPNSLVGQTEFASMLGVKRQMVDQLRTGKRPGPPFPVYQVVGNQTFAWQYQDVIQYCRDRAEYLERKHKEGDI